MRVIIMWAIVCMISVGIHGLGIMRNIICIIIVVGDIKRLRLAIILGWIMEVRGRNWGSGLEYTIGGRRVHCIVCSKRSSSECMWEMTVP
jgi:hypothetical protein